MPLDPNPPKPLLRQSDLDDVPFDLLPPSEQIKRRPGLGDRVEKLAQPIAKVIDRVAGTNVQGCGGCQKRKEWLNERFPAKAKS